MSLPYRICPKCWRRWIERADWDRDCVHVGREKREVAIVEVWEHMGCGGKMYGSGVTMLEEKEIESEA